MNLNEAQQQIATLNEQVVILQQQLHDALSQDGSGQSEGWAILTDGWLASALYERISREKIDQTAFLLGVLTQDIKTVTKAYRSLVKVLSKTNEPVSAEEDAEIKQLLVNSGLAQ